MYLSLFCQNPQKFHTPAARRPAAASRVPCRLSSVEKTEEHCGAVSAQGQQVSTLITASMLGVLAFDPSRDFL